MASFRKRGTSWLAEVRLKGVHKAQSFPTKGEAQQWATEVERKIRAGQGQSVHNRTVRDAFDRYSEEVSVRKASRVHEQQRLVALSREPFAMKRMDEIATPDMASWRDARLKTVSGSTVNRDFNLVSNVFAVARDEWHWIAVNPCTLVRRPKENAPRERRVSVSELAMLYTAAGDDTASVSRRAVACFEFCIETAMRGGEALSLSRRTIHGNVARLAKTKNGDARDVPLSLRAMQILGMYPDGFGISSAQKDAMFRKVREKTGLLDLTFHDSRHEGISRLAAVFDVLELARIVGHRDIRELMTYFHADAASLALKLQRAERTNP